MSLSYLVKVRENLITIVTRTFSLLMFWAKALTPWVWAPRLKSRGNKFSAVQTYFPRTLGRGIIEFRIVGFSPKLKTRFGHFVINEKIWAKALAVESSPPRLKSRGNKFSHRCSWLKGERTIQKAEVLIFRLRERNSKGIK